jgi:integrase
MEQEHWQKVPGYPKYEVSLLGNVRWTGSTGTRAVKPFKTKFGYLKVNFNQKHFFVHRLVMLAWAGPSELECNHLNGIKTDNRFENLEYVTHSENARHAVRNGLIKTKVEEPGATVGSLSATASSGHKTGWRIRRVYYVQGKRCHKSVPYTAWYSLGFTDSMTLEQAKARATQLNSESAVKRKDQTSIMGIASRVERDRLFHSAFIPEDRNVEFIKWLEVNTSGTDAYIQKVKIVWRTAKQTIIKLQLLPEHFASNKKQIFRYLAMRPYSADYVRKITGLMNQYGRFCARITGKYYDPIPAPRGSEREMINDAYRASKTYRGPSDPLTPEMLEDLKQYIPIEQYNWLYVTVWFGLRPLEATMIMKDRAQRYWKLSPGTTDVLDVYQSKLKSVPEPMRWKHIPIKYPEQKHALALLMEGACKAPLTKVIQSHSNNERLNLYGGRKNFVDMMLDLGEPLDAISSWLGHASIQITWSKYKDRRRVNYGTQLASSIESK